MAVLNTVSSVVSALASADMVVAVLALTEISPPALIRAVPSAALLPEVALPKFTVASVSCITTPIDAISMPTPLEVPLPGGWVESLKAGFFTANFSLLLFLATASMETSLSASMVPKTST